MAFWVNCWPNSTWARCRKHVSSQHHNSAATTTRRLDLDQTHYRKRYHRCTVLFSALKEEQKIIIQKSTTNHQQQQQGATNATFVRFYANNVYIAVQPTSHPTCNCARESHARHVAEKNKSQCNTWPWLIKSTSVLIIRIFTTFNSLPFWLLTTTLLDTDDK